MGGRADRGGEGARQSIKRESNLANTSNQLQWSREGLVNKTIQREDYIIVFIKLIIHLYQVID